MKQPARPITMYLCYIRTNWIIHPMSMPNTSTGNVTKQNKLVLKWMQTKKAYFNDNTSFYQILYNMCRRNGSVLPVLVTKLTNAIQTGHGEHSPLVGLADIVFTDHQLDAVPTLGLVQPLVGVHRHLSSQRLGQHQHVPHHRVFWSADRQWTQC